MFKRLEIYIGVGRRELKLVELSYNPVVTVGSK